MKKRSLFSKWFIIPVILVVMVAAIILGSTWSFFTDTETSNYNTMGAWASTNWTQTTQADFNAGVVSSNISTSDNPGNVQLALNATSSFAPTSNATGNWTTSNNAYVSDNLYATESPNVLVLTKNPTSNAGGAWANPTRAYDNGGAGYANITSSSTGTTTWGNYGFVLGNNVTTNVSVRYDAWATPNITFQAAGVVANAGSGNVTPALPAGWAPNDIWLLLVSSLDNVSSTLPAGWNSIDTGTNNAATLRTALYWRRAVAGDTAPTVSHTKGAGISAVIIGYRGVITSGSPFDVNQSVFVKSPASAINQFGGGMTTTGNGETIVLLSGVGKQTTSVTYTGSPTPTEEVDGPNAGSRPELIIADFVQTAAGATGNRTSTITSGLNNGYQLSLKPATDYPQINVSVTWDNGTSWSSNQTQTLTSTNTTYRYDVTAAATWNATTLNNTNFQVRVGVINTGTPMPVNLDWLPVVVSTYNASVLGQQYSNYGINLASSYIQKVEVGIEAFATSADKVSLQVSSNNGTTWSTVQNSGALPLTDPGSTTWFDFTSAANWTTASLNNTNFRVLIQYLNDGLNDGTVGTVSLDYIPVRITYRPATGNISSQVLNTTVNGSTWDGMAWDSTLNSGGNITFSVRASNTLFAANATTPAWTSNATWATNGSTTIILSGLPAGQYKQWMATLNSTANATPVLSEVRVYYYGP